MGLSKKVQNRKNLRHYSGVLYPCRFLNPPIVSVLVIHNGAELNGINVNSILSF